MHKMLVAWTFVLLVAFLMEPTQSEITYMAECYYDVTTGFFTTVGVEKAETDTIHQIAALQSTSTIVAGCIVTQDGISNRYISKYTLDPAGASVSPAACETAFTKIDSNSDGTVDEVYFTFLVQSTKGYVLNTDIIFEWKCTTSDHGKATIQSFSITALPINSLNLKSQFALEVCDATGSVVDPYTELTLGGSYFLRVKHTYANSKNRQTGIYVNRLVFYEGTDSTTSPYVVSIEGGCKQTVLAYELTANFLKDADNSIPLVGGGAAAGGTDGVYVTTSGIFKPALWLKSTGISANLKIEADIAQCLFDDQSSCDDPETNVCVGGMRRRRAAEDTGLQNLTTLGTRFTISLLAGNNDQISGTKDNKGTMETSYQAYTFWIVALVFGILMLICLIFAVYLFFRLRREKESRRKTEEKYGVINPAF
ncbi:hypothetical protein ACJMK2_041536 [Sinanodonta woodiana]|uniref:Transmembrane protein n=1 Tax=Sinanodonta woodiana TaxID=1069815 RepID=A0ABD3W6C7_SINWO